MNQKLKNVMKNQRGVTLIELLVVVVILGIIAAVAIPMISGNQDKANESTNQQNLNILQDAVERYYINNNKYPDSLAVLKDDDSNNNNQPYIREVPKVAGTGNDFHYNSTSGLVSEVAPTP